MEPEASSTRTTSTPSRSTFSRTIPHCGRARARTRPVPATRKSARRTNRVDSRGLRTTRDQSGRATRRAVRARSRRVEIASTRAASGRRRRPRSHQGEAKIMRASRGGHAQAPCPQEAGESKEDGGAQENGEEQLAVAAIGGEPYLGLLELVDAVEDRPERLGVGG